MEPLYLDEENLTEDEVRALYAIAAQRRPEFIRQNLARQERDAAVLEGTAVTERLRIIEARNSMGLRNALNRNFPLPMDVGIPLPPLHIPPAHLDALQQAIGREASRERALIHMMKVRNFDNRMLEGASSWEKFRIITYRDRVLGLRTLLPKAFRVDEAYLQRDYVRASEEARRERATMRRRLRISRNVDGAGLITPHRESPDMNRDGVGAGFISHLRGTRVRNGDEFASLTPAYSDQFDLAASARRRIGDGGYAERLQIQQRELMD